MGFPSKSGLFRTIAYTSGMPKRSRLISSFPAPVGKEAIEATIKDSLIYKIGQCFVCITSGIGTAYIISRFL